MSRASPKLGIDPQELQLGEGGVFPDVPNNEFVDVFEEDSSSAFQIFESLPASPLSIDKYSGKEQKSK